CIPAVGRFVNTHARLRVARGIGLAGAGVENAARVGKRSDRICYEAAGDKRATRSAPGKCVGGAPDSAACCCRPYPARPNAAAWIDGKRGNAARREILSSAEGQYAWIIRYARTDQLPRAERVLPDGLALELLEPSYR